MSFGLDHAVFDYVFEDIISVPTCCVKSIACLSLSTVSPLFGKLFRINIQKSLLNNPCQDKEVSGLVMKVPSKAQARRETLDYIIKRFSYHSYY